MHKIYSRPRLKIPRMTEKRRKIVKIILVLTIAFSTVKIVLDAVLPIFDTLCENRAKAIATIISNEQATNVMKEHSYDELFSIEKDEQGNIKMITTNVIPINEIISDIAVRIQNEIDKQGREDIQIALGSFTGFKLFAGKGPGVKIRISSIGNVETDLISDFESQGINQTVHRVFLEVKCKISILTPFDDIEKEITNQVLLVENVIIGEIPDSYYNLKGLEGYSDAMEVIE